MQFQQPFSGHPNIPVGWIFGAEIANDSLLGMSQGTNLQQVFGVTFSLHKRFPGNPENPGIVTMLSEQQYVIIWEMNLWFDVQVFGVSLYNLVLFDWFWRAFRSVHPDNIFVCTPRSTPSKWSIGQEFIKHSNGGLLISRSSSRLRRGALRSIVFRTFRLVSSSFKYIFLFSDHQVDVHLYLTEATTFFCSEESVVFWQHLDVCLVLQPFGFFLGFKTNLIAWCL